MYRIRGADGTETGPHSVETLRAWLRDGRVQPGTAARLEGGTEWMPLREFPEFTGVAPAALASPGTETAAGGKAKPLPPPLPPLPPLPPSPRRTAVSAPPPAHWSALAIASFVLGCVGFLIIPAFLSLACGILALSRIRRSQGRLRGGSFANIGIVLSLVMLMAVGFGAFWAARQQHGFRPASRPMMTTQSGCTENLTQLANAVRQFANDHGDILPSATNWCDQVREYVPSMAVYSCPGGPPERRSSFALNRNVAGQNQDRLAPTMVLLFESPQGWNAAGAQEIADLNGRSIHVALVNGQVMRVDRRGLEALKWNP